MQSSWTPSHPFTSLKTVLVLQKLQMNDAALEPTYQDCREHTHAHNTHIHTHTHTLTHPETSSREAVQLPFGKSRQQGTRRACNLVITAFKPQKSRIHPPLTRPAPPPGFTPAQSSAFISNSHAPPFACSPEVAFQKKQSFKHTHTHTQNLTTVSQT